MRRDDEISPTAPNGPSLVPDPAALLRAGASLHGFWRDGGVEGAELSALEKILAAGPQTFRRHLERPGQPRSAALRQFGGRPAHPQRFAPQAPAPASTAAPGTGAAAGAGPLAQAIAAAEARARAAPDLDALDAEMRQFDLCPLKRTAARTVTFEGPSRPRLMVIGAAPSREDDDQGRPWTGKAGALLDAMLAAIDLDRKTEVLCCHTVFWRPPGDRDPVSPEFALCAPFVRRAIALAKPATIVLAGSFAAQSMLQRSETIARLRGKKFACSLAQASRGGAGSETGSNELPASESTAFEVPAFVVLEPKHLLLRPQDKARAWEDLLVLRHALARNGETGA